MKIGIMTFHRADNLGAVLQAYALTQYINSLGDAELIDFVPNNQCPKYGMLIQRLLHNCKAVITYPFTADERKRSNSFKCFRKYLKYSKNTYFGDSTIFNNPPKYDLLVSGSDQILNLTLSGYSKGYYLGFDDSAKKISYASSFGRTVLTDEEHELIKKELPKFSYLSTREQSAADIISNEINRSIQVVLDPVFLLSRSAWKAIESKKLILPEKYILVYAMEKTQGLLSTIELVKRETEIPIVCVYGGGSDFKGLPGQIVQTCGPAEFLSYINGAEIVVTNSFHGTAFSIIMGKRFVCVAHSSRNVRLENLMELINERDLLVSSDIAAKEIGNFIVLGNTAYDKLGQLINQSKQYLKDSILGTE